MKKFFSFLKGTAAAVLLLSAATTAYAAPASIMGDYTFTSDVVYADGISDALKEGLPSSFEFKIDVRSPYSDLPKVFDFINTDFSANIDYNPSTGVITQGLYQQGIAYIDETMVVMKGADGTGEYDEYQFSWTVDDAGVITIPTFTICTYAGDLVATYSNGVAKPVGGGDPDPGPTPGGSYPASVMGDYTFTSNVVYAEGISDALKAGLPSSFDFKIDVRSSFSDLPKVFDFINPDFDANISYDASTGVITQGQYQQGIAYIDETMVVMKGADGTGEYDEYLFSWNVDESGVITIPTFTICTYAGDLVATYSDGIAKPAGGSDPDPGPTPGGSYPASVMGDYSFTSDVVYAEGISDALKEGLPSSFEFKIDVRSDFSSEPKVFNFINPDFDANISYNPSTGVITQGQYQQGIALIDETMVVMKGADGTGEYDEYLFTWNVNESGLITIPTFTICTYAGDLVATYSNCVAKPAGSGDDPTPGPGEDDGTYPETVFGKYLYTGSVEYGAKATAEIQAKLPASFNFNIILTDDFNPKTQVPDFLVYDPVNLTYNATTGVIAPGAYQEFRGNLPNVEYIIVYGDAEGENMESDWSWTVNSKGDITIPTFTVCDFVGNVYATYSGGVAKLVEEIPATVEGKYKFTGTVEYAANLADETKDVLPEEFDFNIVITDDFNPKTQIQNFFFFDPVNVTYNAETGAITPNAYQYFSYFGVPGVEYMVVLGNADGSLYASDYDNWTWTVDTKGTITFPTFTVCDFVGNVLATYNGAQAILVSGPGSGGNTGANHDFEGTFNTTDWWIADYTKYNDNEHYSVTSGNDVSITINDNNQYTALAGYDIDSTIIEYGYNQGIVKGNVWDLEINNFNNVLTRNSEEDPSGLVIGGPEVPAATAANFVPETGTSMTLTYTSTDDSYTLSDFTIWQKTVTYNEAEGTNTTTYKVLYKYSTSEILANEPGEKDPTELAGTWAFTLNDHYQGASSKGKFSATYVASVSGNTVTFKNDDYPWIVAELNEEGNALTFKYAKATNLNTVNTVYQSPYINATGTDDIADLTEEQFTALFDAEAGTITFPDNSGVRYGYFTADGELNYWSEAYDFVTAINPRVNTEASITLSGVDHSTLIDESQEFFVNFSYSTVNVPANATIKAILLNNGDAFNSMTVNGSPVYWNMTDVSQYGIYNFTLYLEASVDGEVIAKSNLVEFSVETSGIDGISADDENGVSYYNLQGVKVEKPASGIYIVRKGNETKKVLVK